MARPKKEGKHINVKIRQDLYEEFEECCKREERTKTAVLERMMRFYLDAQKEQKNNTTK